MTASDLRIPAQPASPARGRTVDAIADLVRLALDPVVPDLGPVLQVLADAAGVRGAALWERSGADGFTLVGVSPAAALATAGPEATTLEAARTGSLAIAPAVPPGGHRGPYVVAALPVPSPGTSPGALTLLGDRPLSPDGFDVLADLMAVVPLLCSAVRGRRTIALAARCREVLDEADRQGSGEPLSQDDVVRHLDRVCAVAAERLGCRAVRLSLWLDAEAAHAVVASSTGEDDAVLTLDDGWQPVPVVAGERTWGSFVCLPAGAAVASSLAGDLAPVAAHVARFWSGWLQHRTIAAENVAWRRLAAGVTEFNRLAAHALGRPDGDDAAVYAGAWKVLGDVVPQVRTGGVRRTGDDAVAPVWVAPAGVAEQAAGFVVRRPIRVGDRGFGVLEAAGDPPVAPEHAPQVCEILADQLGLYHYLGETLGHLRVTREKLQRTVRGQAEALEDLEHQLVSPLITATARTERVLAHGRFDSRTESQLRAVRGLCRKASRVAQSAGMFAALSQQRRIEPRLELVSGDELVRAMVLAAADAQQLSDPQMRLRFEVDREWVPGLGRRLVDVDRGLLDQCLGNLLDNAAKYSFADTQVRIGARIGGRQLLLEVASTGIAPAAEELPLCRERNWRSRSARSTTGEGSGLGLWIVDHLMASMGGRLDLRVDGAEFVADLACPIR